MHTADTHGDTAPVYEGGYINLYSGIHHDCLAVSVYVYTLYTLYIVYIYAPLWLEADPASRQAAPIPVNGRPPLCSHAQEREVCNI